MFGSILRCFCELFGIVRELNRMDRIWKGIVS